MHKDVITLPRSLVVIPRTQGGAIFRVSTGRVAGTKYEPPVRYADVPLSTTSTVTWAWHQAVGVRFGLAALLRTPRQIHSNGNRRLPSMRISGLPTRRLPPWRKDVARKEPPCFPGVAGTCACPSLPTMLVAEQHGVSLGPNIMPRQVHRSRHSLGPFVPVEPFRFPLLPVSLPT